ncbi:TonB-dependent receptor plug domain-containing protein [Agaribacterium sp. ZY112]|uniref:TonB-dependent receptor plug domain-containing protein n=1 Tax=Agaribacterium sp. ZY112 TaxID=3233574 RepID=UPI0035256226
MFGLKLRDGGAWALSTCILLSALEVAAESSAGTEERVKKDLDQLEEVVITGTRTEKLLSESPVSVEVISGSDIQAVSSTGTLEQALQYIPGVYMQRSEKEGFNILMRGFDGDRVLVLVDGQRLLAPTGSSVDFAQISSLDIERIEVVRGAASALYGSEAIGGVINIITKKNKQNQFFLAQTFARYTDNEIDDFDSQTRVGATINYKAWALDAVYQSIEAPAFDPDLTDNSQLGADQDKTIASAKLSYNSDLLSAAYKYQDFQESKYRVTGAFPGGSDNYYTSDVEKNAHSFIADFDQVELKAQAIQHDEISGQRGSLRQADISLVELDAQYAWQLDAVEWLSGLHYYQDGLSQIKLGEATPEVDDEEQGGVEAFLQADWQASEKWEWVVGGRIQNDEGYGAHTALRGNVKFDQDLSEDTRFVWRTSLGEGYRVPNIKEQYYLFDHSNLGYIIIGNEDLVPEESVSFNTEIELNQELDNSATLTTTLSTHYSDARNFIDTVYSPELSEEMNLDVYQYQNFAKTRISGVDADVAYSKGSSSYRLSYNYLDARDAITEQRLESRPYHQVKANYKTKLTKTGLELLLYAVYQADEAHDPSLVAVNNGYTTFNLSLAQDIAAGFRWQLGLDNLTNEHRAYKFKHGQEFDPRPEAGRYVSATIEYLLK